MTKNEIVRRLREAGINASSIDRSASAFIQDATGIRATAGWFGFRITCDNQATERRVRVVLERYYNVEISGSVWRLRTKRRLSVMASGGLFPPAPPTPPSTKSPMYLEAAEANSTVSMVSTLETAPNLEYSTDGVTWQPWEYTTAEGTHTFDTITLGAIGDKVYFRGDNPNGLANLATMAFSNFSLTGAINGGGNVMSLLDTTMALTEVPASGFGTLFAIMGEGIEPALLTPPLMDTITTIGNGGCDSMYDGCTSLTAAADMPALTTIGDGGCIDMYDGCTSLTAAADMPALTTIGDGGCDSMYYGCTSLTAAADMPSLTTIGGDGCNSMYDGCTSLTAAADMPALTTIGDGGCDSMYYGCTSLTAAADMPALTTIGDDGCRLMYYGCDNLVLVSDGILTFDFAPLPVTTTGGITYNTANDVAEWMTQFGGNA